MKKRLLSAVLSAVMAASLLVGCGGAKKGAENASESAKAEKTEEKSGEAVTLDFWTIDLKANFGDFFNELIQKYEEENKGVKINWTDIPFADVQSKLVAAVAGGTAPDVVNLNTQMALTLAGQGALVDLNKAAKTFGSRQRLETLYMPSLGMHHRTSCSTTRICLKRLEWKYRRRLMTL